MPNLFRKNKDASKTFSQRGSLPSSRNTAAPAALPPLPPLPGSASIGGTNSPSPPRPTGPPPFMSSVGTAAGYDRPDAASHYPAQPASNTPKHQPGGPGASHAPPCVSSTHGAAYGGVPASIRHGSASTATSSSIARPSSGDCGMGLSSAGTSVESMSLGSATGRAEGAHHKYHQHFRSEDAEMTDGHVGQYPVDYPEQHHGHQQPQVVYTRQQQQQQHPQQRGHDHSANYEHPRPQQQSQQHNLTQAPPGLIRSETLTTPLAVQAGPDHSQPASMGRKTTSRYALSDFALIRTLGTGSFGRVHLARSRHNGRGYAIKVLNKARVVQLVQVEHTNSEREMLDRVRHPFLVNLWGTFADARNLYMVMDFIAGGELFSLLRKSQKFPDPVAKFFAAEVALALDYLHSTNIIYRDLKPENILLGADGHVKITDFGFAKYVPDITWTLCGTPDYLAPEIVQSKGYNKSVDWYALGVLIYEMLAGYPPFFTEDSNPMKLYEKITTGKVRWLPVFSSDARDLVEHLLQKDLTQRYGNLANGSRDVFLHPWFREVDWGRLYRKEIPAPYIPRVQSEHDASNFDQYPENDCSEYGQPGPDPHGALFPCF